MNNSKIAIDNISLELDEEKPNSALLRGQETHLAEIIDAVEHIKSSAYWKTLENRIFKGVVESLHKRLKNEIEPVNIYRLQGQIAWAEKYLDLDKLVEVYKLEYQQIQHKIKQSN